MNHTHPPRGYLTHRFTCSRRLNRMPGPRASTASPSWRLATPTASATPRTSDAASAPPAPAEPGENRVTTASHTTNSNRATAHPRSTSKSRNTGRGSSGPFTEVSNLSFGSGICFRFASKAHLPTSASFRTRAPARYPASYTKTIREEFPVLRPLPSCCLSAAGIRFLSTLSCQGIQPPLRSAYRTACAYPRLRCGPMARFPRSARVRPRPGRALSVPREQRCSPATLHPRPPPAASQRLVPATPATQPSPECELDEASARVSW